MTRRGFTLIELMIAMVVSSLLVGMILAIFLRMSVAYRGQQQVSDVQQVLSAARSMIESDAKHAGLMTANGVAYGTTTGSAVVQPVVVVNSNSGPDTVTFIYADTSIQAAVTTATIGGTVGVDDNSQFPTTGLVIVATPDTTTLVNPSDSTGAKLTTFQSCLLTMTGKTGTTSISLSTTAPYGNLTQSFCSGIALNKTMVYRGVAVSYRIDPSRPADGVLQRSLTANLYNTNDWEDLGYGFTDLQVATQFYESAATTDSSTDTNDPDTDATRDWYSSTKQQTITTSVTESATHTPIQMTISLVARTDKNVEGVATAATPDLTVSTNTANNTVGDRASVDLTTTADPMLTGSRIYRYTTFGVDFRNLGVGR